ncbi:MAG TPA: radical SAM protein [Acidimicrobiia bacterium]
MTVELRPLGVACNLQCQYCYQNPQRDAGNVPREYDLDRMKAAIEREGGEFTLFGGEPLLVPEADLEELWSWGLERYGANGIQTNGALINDAHIRMFRQYKVQVGISMDGPGELNDGRWAGTAGRTRDATAKTEAAIERLCREGLAPSLIVTLHRGNATAEKLPVMHEWLRRMEAMGVTSARLHVLEVEGEDVRAAYALSTEENLTAFMSFAELEKELTTLQLDLFNDLRNLLMGTDDETTCVWNACDPYTTRAVRGVEGQGQSSNCGRTNKDGIDFVKSSQEGFERYLALYNTPQDQGGCNGCRFFLMCKGQCPGTAIDGDWRNRTEHCDLWKALFREMEEQFLDAGQVPISASPERADLEAAFLELWASGDSTSVAGARRWLEQRRQDGEGNGHVASAERATTAPAVPSPSAAAPTGAHGMDRLGFVLPDFTRFAWVSDTARDVWEPRLDRVREAWSEIEWRAVLAGVRSCAVVVASPEEFLALGARWAEEGLSALPVEMMGASGQAYSATTVSFEPGQPFVFRFVVGRPSDVAAFKKAWDEGDDEAIGDALGYPSCCRDFFQRVWVDDAMVDTTWPMAMATTGAEGARSIDVTGPPQSNILWRWMGARAVPHLPCRFDCDATVKFADDLVAVGREAGFGEEMDWLLEILSWPVQWSALHGIAEVRTPIVKVSTRTDATASRYVVQRHGDGYPAEGARGLDFPYRVPVKLHLTETRGFRRGLDHAGGTRNGHPPWYATDNGFSSITAMREAHAPIIDAATEALAGAGGDVIDLGCGNGVLVQQIVQCASGAVPYGIDSDATRVEHAQRLQPEFAGNFVAGDLFDDESPWADGRRFALAIVMPGRFLEVDARRAEVLRQRLRDHCDQVLVYAYGDWLADTDMAGLAKKAGLSVLNPGDKPVALAEIVDVESEGVLQ